MFLWIVSNDGKVSWCENRQAVIAADTAAAAEALFRSLSGPVECSAMKLGTLDPDFPISGSAYICVDNVGA